MNQVDRLIAKEVRDIMFGYKIEIRGANYQSEHEDTDYGAWSSSQTNHLDEFIYPTLKYPDAVTPFELKSGDRCFVVWVEWSSGNSFGRGDRSSTEIIGAFLDPAAAFELKNALEIVTCEYKIKTRDGQLFESGYAPWCGYFESLDEIHVDQVTFVGIEK